MEAIRWYVRNKWFASTDEERFVDGPYMTYEEAVERAPIDNGYEPGQKFWVGRAERIDPEIDAREIIERAEEYASEEVGEAADDWPSATPEQEDDLGRRLTAVLRTWLKKIGEAERVCKITNISEHVAQKENSPNSLAFKDKPCLL